MIHSVRCVRAPPRVFSWRLLRRRSRGVLAASAPAAEPPRVLAVEFENDVNPVTQDYLVGEMHRAERDGYDAVVILMDTPGGLASSMRKIVKELLDLKIPGSSTSRRRARAQTPPGR